MAQRIFATAREAREALQRDKLALVTFSASSVFVSTAHGTGTFTREEWRDGGGPGPSVAQADGDDGGPVSA